MKRLSAFLVLLAAIALLAWWLLTPREAIEEDFWSGYGEAELVYVASPIGGALQDLAVVRGDQVAKGARLFALERDQEIAARNEAEANLREARSRLDMATLDFNRAQSLRSKRVNSAEDFDAARQNLLAAQHHATALERSLEQADWRLHQKEQDAPAGGLVYDTYFRPGEWVAAGRPVLSLLPPEYMKVRFFVPETDLGKLQPGRKVAIRLDGYDGDLAGTVNYVSPRAEYTLPIIYSRENRSKLVYLVEARLAVEDAPKLHPGAPVEVRLIHEQ